MGSVVVLTAGRERAGVQVGNWTEVQAVSKVSGAIIPSSAERVRVAEKPARVLKSEGVMVVILLFWVLTMGQEGGEFRKY